MAVKSLAQSSILQPSNTNSMLTGYESNYFHHLETVRLAGNAASVTFNNLARYSDYQHLQIRAIVNCTTSASNQFLRFNGDSSASYRWHYLSATGSSVISGTGFSTDKICFVIANADANNFSGSIVDILDPFDTAKNTTVRAFYGSARSGSNWLDLESGVWFNTAAINSIEFGFGQNWIAGSRFSLYGIKAR